MDLKQPRKIVLTGPESSGKSQLCRQLAQHYNCSYAPEYARFFLEQYQKRYDFDLLLTIVREHLAFQQKKIEEADNLIFLDTDLLNFKIWEQEVYGKVHPFIEEKIPEEKNHSYLLLYPDIPWEADPLRENPDNRPYLFERHKSLLEELNRPFRIIKGDGAQRFKNALSAIDELI